MFYSINVSKVFKEIITMLSILFFIFSICSIAVILIFWLGENILENNNVAILDIVKRLRFL